MPEPQPQEFIVILAKGGRIPNLTWRYGTLAWRDDQVSVGAKEAALWAMTNLASGWTDAFVKEYVRLMNEHQLRLEKELGHA